MRIRRLGPITAATLVALTLTACGGTDDAGDDLAPDTTTDDVADASDASDEEMSDMSDDDMGDMDMDMGSADGERADEVDADSLRQAEFALLDSAPEAFEDATGTASLALGPTTWATIDLAGLPAGAPIVAHLHAEECAADGGPHFAFDPDGPATPPNEVHLAGDAADGGTLSVSVANEMVADVAMSMVFHQAEGDTTKVACADLPPSED